MNIDWGALGEVFVVSFGAAIAVIVLFSLGIRALAGPATDPTSAPGQTAGNVVSRPAVAVLCFLACAVVVGYGLYLIIVK
ncbi:MAG: hypothetical protein LC749_09220 [Actinobacteria bacterium]|nr:hypothetical protein [Actinomycetota bacterium]